MVNPLQRKKNRTNAPKVSLSRKQMKKKKKLKFSGPKVFRENWDSHATPRQNYERLGIMAVLNPRQAGGLVKNVGPSYKASDVTLDDLEKIANGESSSILEPDASDSEDNVNARSNAKKNAVISEGRIIRDDSGNIIRVVIDDEAYAMPIDEATDRPLQRQNTPWGPTMEEIESNIQLKLDNVAPSRQGLQYTERAAGEVAPKTDFVKKIEQLAEARSAPTIRHESIQEHQWLASLVAKHGDDIEAMSRDLKLNTYQKSPGQIRRSFKKAGGIEVFLSQA